MSEWIWKIPIRWISEREYNEWKEKDLAKQLKAIRRWLREHPS